MASEDIRKMLPVEAVLFDEVNAAYRTIMLRAVANRNALSACTVVGYLGELEGMDKMLEVIQKALDAYLENKRQCFPRFYFLSNDDLLEILGQSKDPEQVQKHIKKVRRASSKRALAPCSLCLRCERPPHSLTPPTPLPQAVF